MLTYFIFVKDISYIRYIYYIMYYISYIIEIRLYIANIYIILYSLDDLRHNQNVGIIKKCNIISSNILQRVIQKL
jgi:hypothetical protein